MEGEIPSKNSTSDTSMVEEVLDSNSTSRPSLLRKPSIRLVSTNSYASKFKGLVPQHNNGHWGCQIYVNHQRIWLGTFKSKRDAAMAYDSAAIKLRNRDFHQNFPITDVTTEEPNFQSYYSTEAVLSMIKNRTYQFKFAEFKKTHSQNVGTGTGLGVKLVKAQGDQAITSRQLFFKELTPSDVGKLNRLVIPKKYALKFFPQASVEEKLGFDNGKEVQLAFYDKSMKLWNFRYCYWRNSQSYVFTRGWNQFVKEKQLKTNDTITFCFCEYQENAKSTQSFYMIDVIHGETTNGSGLAGAANQSSPMLDIAGDGMDKPRHDAGVKGFRLFGVKIV